MKTKRRIFDSLLISFILGVIYCICDWCNWNVIAFLTYIASFLSLMAGILFLAYYICDKNQE